MEIWKPITGYEGIYEVSSLGNVKACEGPRGNDRYWDELILKQKTDKDGRKRVNLWKDGKPMTFLVHRLVATEFCHKEEGKDIINHIDCNPSNNEYTNLEWCNHYENLMHAYDNGLNTAAIKVSLINDKTGDKHDFYSMAEASRFLGCNNGHLSLVLKRGRIRTKGFSIVLPDK